MEKQLEKLYEELQNECGNYWWENPQDDGTIEISCADCMADAVEGIIEDNGYEIIDEGEFSGSSYDGVTFTIRKEE